MNTRLEHRASQTLVRLRVANRNLTSEIIATADQLRHRRLSDFRDLLDDVIAHIEKLERGMHE
jgi:hypothetical protein